MQDTKGTHFTENIQKQHNFSKTKVCTAMWILPLLVLIYVSDGD